MELFHAIDDAEAIIRKGVILKQVKLYQRGGTVYVPHSGGYVRITAKLGNEYGTADANVKVIDLDGPGIVLDGLKAPAFRPAALKAVA